ncbi:hypothetical protein GH714_014326 [Hevea brasiliensis]|uniref:Uncharacterized protein n=1 Tax=Hevea brasiliensis TaxID=3981 RepID=A0A6A6KD33_HEVBR|nr:hypothetical protein GH714_014326 [Hevea brasiliensis]
MTLAKAIERELQMTMLTKESKKGGGRGQQEYGLGRSNGPTYSKNQHSQQKSTYFAQGANKERKENQNLEKPNSKILQLPAPPEGSTNKGNDEEVLEDIKPEIGKDTTIEGLQEGHFKQLELLLYSVRGIFGPKTMKFQGCLHGQEVTIMIDSGVSHNFIANNLVTKLELQVTQTPPFGVRLGDGHRTKSSRLCARFQLELDDFTLSSDYYIFPLSGIDLILGVAWLAILGDVKVN